MVSGFDRSALSVLGCSSGIAQKLGVKKCEQLMDNPRAQRGINIAPEEIGVAEGVIIGVAILMSLVIAFLINGSLITPNATKIAITACLIGLVVGLFVIKLIDFAYTQYLHNQIKKGGIILWVEASEKEQISLAREIFVDCNELLTP